MNTLDRPEFHEEPEDKSTKLTLEHQFYYVSSVAMIEKSSKEQLQGLFKTLLLSYLSQQEYYQALVKHEWGIGESGINRRPTNEERESKDTND